MLCDDIFGERNFINDIIWKSRKSVQNDTIISLAHNHTLTYAKNKQLVLNEAKEGKMFRKVVDRNKFSNSDGDPRGPWVADPFHAPDVRQNLIYEIVNPNTGVAHLPPEGKHWRMTEENFKDTLLDERIVWGKTGRAKPQLKRFLFEVEQKGEVYTTIWDNLATTTEATRELVKIFGEKDVFNYPKPVGFIRQILDCTMQNKNSIVLDFFAGSGTTGQAVLEKNAEDGGNRQFILCTNNENGIAKNVTYPRIKTIATGKRQDGSEYSEGIPSKLRYFKTAFVDKQKTDDQTKYVLVHRCADMIRIREGKYIETDRNAEKWVIFDNEVGILLDLECISQFCERFNEIAKMQNDKRRLNVKLYIFSFNRYDYSDQVEYYLSSDIDFSVVPIPESVLEAYNRVFKKSERSE